MSKIIVFLLAPLMLLITQVSHASGVKAHQRMASNHNANSDSQSQTGIHGRHNGQSNGSVNNNNNNNNNNGNGNDANGNEKAPLPGSLPPQDQTMQPEPPVDD